jgi:hypothetical protein
VHHAAYDPDAIELNQDHLHVTFGSCVSSTAADGQQVINGRCRNVFCFPTWRETPEEGAVAFADADLPTTIPIYWATCLTINAIVIQNPQKYRCVVYMQGGSPICLRELARIAPATFDALRRMLLELAETLDDDYRLHPECHPPLHPGVAPAATPIDRRLLAPAPPAPIVVSATVLMPSAEWCADTPWIAYVVVAEGIAGCPLGGWAPASPNMYAVPLLPRAGDRAPDALATAAVAQAACAVVRAEIIRCGYKHVILVNLRNLRNSQLYFNMAMPYVRKLAVSLDEKCIIRLGSYFV